MTEQEVIRLARQLGIDVNEALEALHAEHAAREAGIKIYVWQRANQEQAKLLMRLAQQNEANLSLID